MPERSRTEGLTIRAVILHSLLLAIAPRVQSFSAIDGAWIGATPLLVLFILGPVIGIWLYSKGQQRVGSIMLLAFMPAAAYTHIQMMLSLTESGDMMAGPSLPNIGFGSLIVLLILSSSLGSLLSFAMLRSVHAGTESHERNTSA